MLKTSIALATYNGARYVDEQLESYARQSRLPDELIVRDDCSDDDTVDRVERFAADSPFPVRLTRNETRLGYVGNFDRAIMDCSGDVILPSDQDDVWLPSKVERLVSILEADSTVGLAFSDGQVVNERLDSLGVTVWHARRLDAEKQAYIRRGDAFQLLIRGKLLAGATIAFRSAFRDVIHPIPVGLAFSHDSWIVFIASAISKVQLVEEPLVMYRRHESQASGLGRYRNRRRLPNRLKALWTGTSLDQDRAFLSKYLDQLREAERRLTAPEVRGLCRPQDLKFLEDTITHLEARLSLPPNRLHRVPTVVNEVRSGRYRLRPGALHCLVRDLVL